MCARVFCRAGAQLFSQNQQDSLTVRLRRRKVLRLSTIRYFAADISVLLDSDCFPHVYVEQHPTRYEGVGR